MQNKKVKNKIYIWILTFVLLSSIAFAYYPGQSIIIPALYSINDIPSDTNANITIRLPNGSINVNTSMVEESTGKFNYEYVFLKNITGGYYMQVNFYNDTGYLEGIAGDFFDVQYNHTEQLDIIEETVNENKGILDNIWDWVQSTLLGIKEYSTQIIGKADIYQTVLFKTSLNFEPTNCEIYINEEVYNMSIDGKIALKNYYISSGGLYEWNVSCE